MTVVGFWGRILRKITRASDSPGELEAVTKGIIPKEFIKRFLPENPVVVEAGAHVGLDTIKMSRLWPKGTICAFEPIPELFKKLKENTHRLKNVICYTLALGARTGTAKMFVSSGASDGSSSLLPPKEHLTEHPDVLFQTEIEVPVTTLDDWAKQQGIDHVDFLWLDVQGYELNVLKAAPHILRSVRVIHVEVSLREVYEGVPLYPEVRAWLEQQGFRVMREELPWPDMGNVLFVRQNGECLNQQRQSARLTRLNSVASSSHTTRPSVCATA